MTQPADPTLSPDVELFTAIDEWKKAWCEVRRLDDEDPALDLAAQKAIRLERKIARMPALTAEGYRARLRSFVKPSSMMRYCWGSCFYSAATQKRLGIADDPPDLRSDW